MTTTPEYRPRRYLSITTLLDFARCPRRYYHRKSGLVPQGDEPTALVYGTAMHYAVPVALQTQDIEPTYQAFLSAWDETLATDKRNALRARQQLLHFIHTHKGQNSLYRLLPPPPEVKDIPVDEKTSDLEIPFILDVGLTNAQGELIPIAGRIDGWARHRDDQSLWAWEFKTASRLTGLQDSMEFSPQVLAYALVLNTVTGLEISGVMVEAMMVDARKVDNQTIPIRVQPHHLQGALKWLRYMGGLLLDMEAREAERAGSPDHIPGESFTQDFSGCSAYLHYYIPGWPCEYKELCRQEDWRDMAGYYSVRPDHEFVKLTQEGQ